MAHPVYTKLSHISDLKTIYIRFIKSSDSSNGKESMKPSFSHFSTSTRIGGGRSEFESVQQLASKSLLHSFSSSTSMLNNKPTKKKIYPKSLSISSMLKLGAVVKEVEKPLETIEVSEFDIHNMRWQNPIEMKFSLDEEPFTKGGFRSVHHGIFNDKKYVIKKFLPSTLEQVDELNNGLVVKETNETLARKAVQMHMLALNITEQFKILCADILDGFGPLLSYKKANLGKILKTGEYVMIEEFIEGRFSKYINNDGSISHEEGEQEYILKAECLVHFSYMKSNQELMLLDIQGSGYNLYDPEIATAAGAFTSDGSQLQFCMGNLSTEACANFIKNHKCNRFCKLANLGNISSD